MTSSFHPHMTYEVRCAGVYVFLTTMFALETGFASLQEPLSRDNDRESRVGLRLSLTTLCGALMATADTPLHAVKHPPQKPSKRKRFFLKKKQREGGGCCVSTAVVVFVLAFV